jgi:hypothetical protein
MLLRRLILLQKTGDELPGAWKNPPIPPRLSPFPRGLYLPPGWRWRAMPCTSGDVRFLLLGQVNISRGNYKAWLLHRDGEHWRLLARIEDHASHAGLHAHAHCGDILPAHGPASINAPVRRPVSRPYRRTAQGRSADAFWAQACVIFRIGQPPAISRQGTLEL